jgi:RNA polymerase sigma-70 factor (ECF subfamily)
MIDDVIALRPRMMSIAYRMLGSVADAEDTGQDAFVRYQTAAGVSSPEGFLVRTTTRLCTDRLRERKRRFKDWLGPSVSQG